MTGLGDVDFEDMAAAMTTGVRPMTCRFFLEFNKQPYPRTCPTCGLSGKCHKGYAQIKKEEGGYELVDDQGVNSSGARIGMDGKPYKLHPGSEGVYGATGGNTPEPIPEGVYYSREHGNFYDFETRTGMGSEFWQRWCSRKDGFPGEPPSQPHALDGSAHKLQEHMRAEEAKREAELRDHMRKQAANPKAVATGERGLASGDKLRIPGTAMFSIPVNKRLKLIGYLADNFDQRGQYTVHDLDGMVDKIASILLDD